MTQDRLKDELVLRRSELDKIDVLEDKIKSELAQLAEKSVQLEQQAGQFSNVSARGRGGGKAGARQLAGACQPKVCSCW